ncbi:MAG: LEA type 2 family protein [Bdellovibrionaceae bacterium]|nr:LEA type 2 family protein [Pseudobdellovibrionaceae bacterium]
MRFFLLPLLLVLGGCANLVEKVLEKPQIDYTRSYVKDPSLEGATAVFVFNVKNPNGVPLKLDELNYRIFLNDKPFAGAQSAKNLSVPAKSESTVEIPLPFRYSDVFDGVLGFLKSREVTYRVEGQAHFALFKIPFSRQGDIRLDGKTK